MEALRERIRATTAKPENKSHSGAFCFWEETKPWVYSKKGKSATNVQHRSTVIDNSHDRCTARTGGTSLRKIRMICRPFCILVQLRCLQPSKLQHLPSVNHPRPHRMPSYHEHALITVPNQSQAIIESSQNSLLLPIPLPLFPPESRSTRK